MKRKGYSLDEIAVQTGGNLIEVQESLFRFDEYESSVSTAEVDLAINDVLIQNAQKIGKALSRGIEAQVVSKVYAGKKKNGEDRYRTVKRPDHATQLTAIDKYVSLANMSRPKTAGVAVNVNQQFNGGASSQASAVRPYSFEQRVRAVNEARGVTVTEDVREVTDIADQSVEDELQGIGIDLDEDEDGDEDDEDDDE